nr:hypothetical protein [Sphingomonadales bacterium]
MKWLTLVCPKGGLFLTVFLLIFYSGYIRVSGQNTVSGRLFYNNQASKSLAGVPVQLKNLTGAILASDTTDSIGFYALGGVANGTYRLDAVLNGGTGGGANATDALLASRHFGQLISLSPWALVAADVDGNGQVNNTDALLIARRGADLPGAFAAGTYCRPIIQWNAGGSPQTVNLQALAVGDVNGSFEPVPSAPALVMDTAFGNGPLGSAVVRFTDPGFGVLERGICWGNDPDPVINGNRSIAGSGGFGFTHHFMGVDPSITQYVRAYAITSQGVYYSNQRSFVSWPGLRCPGQPTMTDQDGFIYYTVLIGNQCWMQSNLRTTRYRNGNVITTGLPNITWQSTTSGAYAVYNISPYTNPTQNDSAWGKLYNHYAVLDIRGICPTGWRIPSESDWNVLMKTLDPQADTTPTATVRNQSLVAGATLKSNRNQPLPGGWSSPNTGATNLSGFSGLPSGYRSDGGTYNSAGLFAQWWSSARIPASGSLPPKAWYRGVDYNNTRVVQGNPFVTNGMAVRCIRN